MATIAGKTYRPKVAVIMGSDSDYPVLEGCIKLLKQFDIAADAIVCSAHRTPERAADIAKNAEKNGIDVIIAAAGKAAHLPGVLASYTTIPVIGIPIKTSALEGLDALLSIVQMPSGIPVATVAIDGAENAALLAIQILAVSNDELKEKLKSYREFLAESVIKKDMALNLKIREAAGTSEASEAAKMHDASGASKAFKVSGTSDALEASKVSGTSGASEAADRAHVVPDTLINNNSCYNCSGEDELK